MILNDRIKNFIKSEFDVAKGMKPIERNKVIIASVKMKFNILISGDDIYEICVRIDRLKSKIEEINESIETKKTYEVIDGNYVFYRKDEAPFKFTVEEIDGMFLDFSAKGKNLTGEEMIQKYKLKPEAWQCIKHRLRLYKASNVISPFTAENSSEGDLNEKIEYAIATHIDTIKGKMIATHEKQFKAEANKAFKTLSNIEYFLDNLRTFIIDYKPSKIEYEKREIPRNGHLDIAFSDIHIGKKNTSDIIARLDHIYNFLLARPETDINIICLGDLGESFAPGGMHPGQVEHMEMHGFELMMFIVKIFEKFLIGLDKAGKNVTFRGIGGNHDRIGVKHGEDIQRTAALAIYEMIKRGISQTEINLQYFIGHVHTFQIGDINYIIHHGDNGFDKRKSEDILWKNGKIGIHNLILHGDKHSGKFQETKNGTMVQVPMLAGKGEYDAMLDLHSEPGFVVIEENEFKTADITFKRLK